MFNNKIFGDRIRKLRLLRNLSLKYVADAIGSQKSTIGNIERGDKSPSIDMMLNLADFFYVSIDYLLSRSDDPRHEECVARTEAVLLKDMPPWLESAYVEEKDMYPEDKLNLIWKFRKLKEEEAIWQKKHPNIGLLDEEEYWRQYYIIHGKPKSLLKHIWETMIKPSQENDDKAIQQPSITAEEYAKAMKYMKYLDPEADEYLNNLEAKLSNDTRKEK